MQLSLKGGTGLMMERNIRPEGWMNRCRDRKIHRLTDGGTSIED